MEYSEIVSADVVADFLGGSYVVGCDEHDQNVCEPQKRDGNHYDDQRENHAAPITRAASAASAASRAWNASLTVTKQSRQSHGRFRIQL